MQTFLPDLAARIINCLNDYRGFCQFTELLKTKELTHTRIQRALLHILLQIRETPKELSFGRVLGFRKSASPLLKEIKKRNHSSGDQALFISENIYCG